MKVLVRAEGLAFLLALSVSGACSSSGFLGVGSRTQSKNESAASHDERSSKAFAEFMNESVVASAEATLAEAKQGYGDSEFSYEGVLISGLETIMDEVVTIFNEHLPNDMTNAELMESMGINSDEIKDLDIDREGNLEILDMIVKFERDGIAGVIPDLAQEDQAFTLAPKAEVEAADKACANQQGYARKQDGSYSSHIAVEGKCVDRVAASIAHYGPFGTAEPNGFNKMCDQLGSNLKGFAAQLEGIKTPAGQPNEDRMMANIGMKYNQAQYADRECNIRDISHN